jgi:hypothetical protein
MGGIEQLEKRRDSRLIVVMPEAAGGEGGHGAAKPEGVIQQ